MPYSKATCDTLRKEYGPKAIIYGCDQPSDDGSGATIPTTTYLAPPETPQTAQTGNSARSLVPVPEDSGNDPANHTLAIVLSTTLPPILVAMSWGLGRVYEWLDRTYPNRYSKTKKFLRGVGFCLWVMRKFLEFLEKCRKSDPEIIPLNPRGQGEENTVFSVAYLKNE